jgi:hypothetical protein
VNPQTKNWWGRSHLDPDSPSVQAGHKVSRHSGEPEHFALEDAFYNQRANWRGERLGVVECRECISIGGVPVEKRTAELWEAQGLDGFPGLEPGTVANAPENTGWSPSTPPPGAQGPAIAHPPGGPSVGLPMNNPSQAMTDAAAAAAGAGANAVGDALFTGSVLLGVDASLILTGAIVYEGGRAIAEGAKALAHAVSDVLGDEPSTAPAGSPAEQPKDAPAPTSKAPEDKAPENPSQPQEPTEPGPPDPTPDTPTPIEPAPVDKAPHEPKSPGDHWVREPNSTPSPEKPLSPGDHWVREPDALPSEPPNEGQNWFQAPQPTAADAAPASADTPGDVSTPGSDGTGEPGSSGSMWSMGSEPQGPTTASDSSSRQPSADAGGSKWGGRRLDVAGQSFGSRLRRRRRPSVISG